MLLPGVTVLLVLLPVALFFGRNISALATETRSSSRAQ